MDSLAYSRMDSLAYSCVYGNIHIPQYAEFENMPEYTRICNGLVLAHARIHEKTLHVHCHYYSWPLCNMYMLKSLGPGRLLATFLCLLLISLGPLIFECVSPLIVSVSLADMLFLVFLLVLASYHLHYITLVGRQNHSVCRSHFLCRWTSWQPRHGLRCHPRAHPYGMRVRTLVGSLRSGRVTAGAWQWIASSS